MEVTYTLETMKALVYESPGRANASVKRIPRPVCGSNQVLMRVMSCGICKPAETSHDRNGSVLGRYPVTPGHEFAGVAVEVGSGVTSVKAGDRITADNGVCCGTCTHCLAGKFAYCTDFGSLGHNLPGGMAEYVLVNDGSVYHIPDTVSFDSAALCELIGCCLHSVDRADIRYGDNVAVLGCGSSGMIYAQLLKHSAAGRVVALDSNQSKLNTIAQKGIETVLVDRENYECHERALRRLFPFGLDKIVDTTGCAPLINRSLDLLKPGGTFVGYSFPTTPARKVEIDMAAFIIKELSYVGSTFQSHSFQRCLDILERGAVDCGIVISHEFFLDDYFEALDLNINDENSVKVIIHPNRQENE